MQERHLAVRVVREGCGVYRPPRIYDYSFFPVNRTFETVLLLQKQYVTQT